MANYYDGIDLAWTTDGDLTLSGDRDLLTTRSDALLAAVQDIYDRGKSDAGDYLGAPRQGASLSDFVGSPNDAVNGEAIKNRLYSALTKDGQFAMGDLIIDVFPVSKDTVMGTIQLAVKPTPANKNTRMVGVRVLYNYTENHVYSITPIGDY